ncbi:MAG TPA: RidA family protein [Xanthobacteraceae bacterium]|nr:RidA family protein [Xanthobacteraceae bacterium]
MTIERWQGSAKGRNRAVRHGGVVYTVATAPGADIQTQTRAALAAIDVNLADAGSDKTCLVSVQIFMADPSQKARMDEVWNDWIGPDWRNWPQRACVGAPLAGATLVEIVVTAAVKQ